MKNKYKNLENKRTNTINAAFGILIITLGLTLVSSQVSAILDPSAVYCGALDYEYIIETNEDGSQTGYCKLPNNQTVDSWAFLKGRVALNWSYCAKEGYKAKHVEDSEICKSCTVCILPDGTEIKVTELMNLSFIAETCGDGTCGLFEDFKTCPKDCPSGELDEYCDGVKDGKCDPDCSLEEDVDCKGKPEESKEEIKEEGGKLEEEPSTEPGFDKNLLLMVAGAIILILIIGAPPFK